MCSCSLCAWCPSYLHCPHLPKSFALPPPAQVIRIDHPEQPCTVNSHASNYHSKALDPNSMRQDVKPLNLVQPEGPSFRWGGLASDTLLVQLELKIKGEHGCSQP
jgi:hypothetical protein